MIFDTPMGKRRFYIKRIIVEDTATMVAEVGMYSLDESGRTVGPTADVRMPLYCSTGNEAVAVAARALISAMYDDVAARLGFDPSTAVQ